MFPARRKGKSCETPEIVETCSTPLSESNSPLAVIDDNADFFVPRKYEEMEKYM